MCCTMRLHTDAEMHGSQWGGRRHKGSARQWKVARVCLVAGWFTYTGFKAGPVVVQLVEQPLQSGREAAHVWSGFGKEHRSLMKGTMGCKRRGGGS